MRSIGRLSSVSAQILCSFDFLSVLRSLAVATPIRYVVHSGVFLVLRGDCKERGCVAENFLWPILLLSIHPNTQSIVFIVFSSNTMSPSSTPDSEWLRKAAAFLGASGTALGAIGAHAFKETLTKRGTLASWQTATLYQLFHATALLGMAAQADSIHPFAGKLLTVGTAMFSGSIYCLSLGIGPKAVLGPTTPLGGLLMISGWVMIGFS